MNKQEAVVLLNQVLNRVYTDKEITNEASAVLFSLFPLVMSPALEILDTGKVTKFVC